MAYHDDVNRHLHKVNGAVDRYLAEQPYTVLEDRDNIIHLANLLSAALNFACDHPSNVEKQRQRQMEREAALREEMERTSNMSMSQRYGAPEGGYQPAVDVRRRRNEQYRSAEALEEAQRREAAMKQRLEAEQARIEQERQRIVTTTTRTVLPPDTTYEQFNNSSSSVDGNMSASCRIYTTRPRSPRVSPSRRRHTPSRQVATTSYHHSSTVSSQQMSPTTPYRLPPPQPTPNLPSPPLSADVLASEMSTETLREISIRYGVTIQQLRERNRDVLAPFGDDVPLPRDIAIRIPKHGQQQQQQQSIQQSRYESATTTNNNVLLTPDVRAAHQPSGNYYAQGQGQYFQTTGHDTVWSIAKEHNVAVRDIVSMNPDLQRYGSSSPLPGDMRIAVPVQPLSIHDMDDPEES